MAWPLLRKVMLRKGRRASTAELPADGRAAMPHFQTGLKMIESPQRGTNMSPLCADPVASTSLTHAAHCLLGRIRRTAMAAPHFLREQRHWAGFAELQWRLRTFCASKDTRH